ncbi:MAG: methyltransferase type 11 [SAR86 cluster bacterium]|uniref:Methyltransferase type 11 n=1 Tax=SAR86 cluster bacterium TaxID=2030880 RepID=A0A2A4X4C9_9GAMM|nr:MAG: methyltransferase type 11 [SAR86 cluster bacterium]
MLRNMLNGHKSGTLANRYRRARISMLLELVKSYKPPVKILDIGGVHHFWTAMDLSEMPECHITFLNKWPASTISELPNSCYSPGDGRSMPQFEDNEFDITFSNSVIEHVGGLRDQKRMAEEAMRVGKSYMVQTPNRRFPIEPHFFLPYFQYYPLWLRSFLHARFDLGWWEKADSAYEALEEVESIRLITKSEFKYLFPDATIVDEKFMLLTKSFTAISSEVSPVSV